MQVATLRAHHAHLHLHPLPDQGRLQRERLRESRPPLLLDKLHYHKNYVYGSLTPSINCKSNDCGSLTPYIICKTAHRINNADHGTPIPSSGGAQTTTPATTCTPSTSATRSTPAATARTPSTKCPAPYFNLHGYRARNAHNAPNACSAKAYAGNQVPTYEVVCTSHVQKKPTCEVACTSHLQKYEMVSTSHVQKKPTSEVACTSHVQKYEMICTSHVHKKPTSEVACTSHVQKKYEMICKLHMQKKPTYEVACTSTYSTDDGNLLNLLNYCTRPGASQTPPSTSPAPTTATC